MQFRLSTITKNLMSNIIVYCMLCALAIGTGAHALTCFESNEHGDMYEVTNSAFAYCVLIPERIENDKYIPGKAFGVGPTIDTTGVYDSIFKLNNQLYQILSLCIYERYDFGKLASRLSFKQPEFMLRCFCNFNGCNREKNFFGYIDNLRADSALHPPVIDKKVAEEEEVQR